jgi:hypothetical protein
VDDLAAPERDRLHTSTNIGSTPADLDVFSCDYMHVIREVHLLFSDEGCGCYCECAQDLDFPVLFAPISRYINRNWRDKSSPSSQLIMALHIEPAGQPSSDSENRPTTIVATRFACTIAILSHVFLFPLLRDWPSTTASLSPPMTSHFRSPRSFP